ncbi:hypothetical protein [Thermogemmatispora onikobensis]|uniref:hypothetical protein n=1 Tax=Thermogemmatispora onikobensis TaxID=732234 RepID=UPI00159EFFEF|nr:hypothetical protein [Thermogemmatispora onikobensis]
MVPVTTKRILAFTHLLERSSGFGLALDLEETFHRLLSLFLQSLAEVQRDPKKGDARP